MQITTHNTPVIAAVTDHLLTGTLPNRRNRVLDTLLDAGTDYLRLLDVKIYQLHDRERPISCQSDAIVEKSKLTMLMIPEDETRVQKFKRLGHGSQKRSISACVLLPGYAVEGSIHLELRACDSLSALRQGLNDFFPVTDAVVANCDVNMTAQLVVVNRAFVTCLCTRPVDEASENVEPADTTNCQNEDLTTLFDSICEISDETQSGIRQSNAGSKDPYESRRNPDVIRRSIRVGADAY